MFSSIIITQILVNSILCEYDHVFTTYVNNTVLLESYPEDAKLGLTSVVQKYGYDVEEHDVVTEDGYIITIFRLPGRRNGKPLLVMHGILDSSDTWFMRGKESVGFEYVKAGWDVWFGNCRGNRYGRRHTAMEPDRHGQFWNYSFHEIGFYDMAAIVDYILLRSGEQHLPAVGHSHGTTAFYVLLSSRPEYNKKVKLFISLAPVAFSHNALGTLVPLIETSSLAFDSVLDILGQHELFGENSVLKFAMQYICYHYVEFCARNLIFAVTGEDREQIDLEFYRSLMVRFPSGTTRKNFVHTSQTRARRRFAHYDYGPKENYEVYGRTVPPDYNLSKITTNIVLIGSRNDGLSSLKDVDLLRRKLPNVVGYHIVKFNLWNHADYLWAKDINKYLMPTVFEFLNKF